MTMKSDSHVVNRLIQHGLDIVFPYEEEIEQVHQVIATELSNNIISEASKQIYVKIMQHLYDEHHVDGIVLGCTGRNDTEDLLRILPVVLFYLLPRNTPAC
jgi:aspartate racemase